jgi:predicted Rossmann fold nucleotide-binding protein DprA/Smf involved in DNA uptake
MEFETLNPRGAGYPKRLIDRLGASAPVLYFQGPLRLLERFTMAVIAADLIPGQAMMAANDMLFKIREYSLNYIGPWHSVMETEIFRLALDTPTDPEQRRSLTIFTARGLARENWDDFLGDRFGYSGPFTGFPQKEEFFRRAKDGELLWLSVAEPNQKRFLRENILLRNWAACALADVVFVPFSEKKAKTFNAVKQVKEAGVPVFTVDHSVCRDLHDLGVQAFTRKTVGKFLDSLGANTTALPPFSNAPASALKVSEPVPEYEKKPSQTSIFKK